jgi:hypothetical protein
VHGDGAIAALCDVEATACVTARSEDAMKASKEKKALFLRHDDRPPLGFRKKK